MRLRAAAPERARGPFSPAYGGGQDGVAPMPWRREAMPHPQTPARLLAPLSGQRLERPTSRVRAEVSDDTTRWPVTSRLPPLHCRPRLRRRTGAMRGARLLSCWREPHPSPSNRRHRLGWRCAVDPSTGELRLARSKRPVCHRCTETKRLLAPAPTRMRASRKLAPQTNAHGRALGVWLPPSEKLSSSN